MKNSLILLIGLSLTVFIGTAFSQSRSENNKVVPAIQSGTKSVQVMSSPELYVLAQDWVNDFRKSNPSANLSLEKTIVSGSGNLDHLTLVSDQNSDQLNWKMVIGRDVLVPIVNASNPMLNLLYQQGISPQKFALLFNDSSKRNWGAIVPNGQNILVQVYVQENVKIISLLKDFCKATVNSSNANFVDSPENVIAGVEKDINAIGFCSLNDLKVYNQASGNENIRFLPIDKNGNGRLDNFENIYRNTDEFARGVWIGKYPGTLTKNIYAVSPAKPTDETEVAFLVWILAEGQKALNFNGYCELASSEKQSNTADLLTLGTTDIQKVQTSSSPQSWPAMLTVLILTGLFVFVYIQSRRRVRDLVPENEIQVAPFLIENAMSAPKGLYFDKTHTWAFMEQDGNVRIGIDDFLQHVTGKLTKIKMKEAGEKVRKGEIIMTIIREGKQLNIYAPISGTILEQNEFLLTDSAIINSSPFYKGWVYQIEPKNWLRESQFMLMGEKYTDWLRDEFVRLKDFVAASVRTDQMTYAHVILQDGGELTDNVLADLGPEIWEDFQTRFIDTSR